MSISRRGFFGSLLGLFGLGSVVKAGTEKDKYQDLLQSMRSMAPGGWFDDRWKISKYNPSMYRSSEQWKRARERVVETWIKRGPKLDRPNNEETLDDMFDCLADQVYLTGMGFVWTIPNKLGVVNEAYVIPTAQVFLCSPTEPNYPNGFYRIFPIYPYRSLHPSPATALGIIIPAQWILKV